MWWRPVLVSVSALLLMAAKFGEPPPAEAPPPEEPRPLVFLLEGIGGLNLMPAAADIGFGSVRLPHEVRHFYWSHGFGCWLRDLQDFRHLHAKSRELAAEIQAIKQREPKRRIFLIAHSAGTGVAIAAAETLPPDTLERVVLLSSALSSHHDLRHALRACKKGIVSYHSHHDVFFLHWGTSHFGTIDRFYQPSAGFHGFEVPGDLSARDRALYARLIQVPWNARMIWRGNFGTHTGSVQPSFLATEIAPWIR